jgi:protocatechuate 4,5-dioxygenase, alpha chain
MQTGIARTQKNISPQPTVGGRPEWEQKSGGRHEPSPRQSDPHYEDIPGTLVFDANRSRQGFWLNQFCMSMMKDENRRAFRADEAGYLDRFPMTEAQRQAILKRDWNGMLEVGGNIYFTAKLAATDGLSFQHIATIMTGCTQAEYAAMMLAGGRPIQGNRSKSQKT